MSSLWFSYVGHTSSEAELLSNLMRVEAFIAFILLSVYLVWKYKKPTDKVANHKIKHPGPGRNTFPTKRRITTATIAQAKILYPVRLPYIDGFYTFYQLQSEGVRVLEDWTAWYGELYHIPLGAITVYPTSDAGIAHKVLMSTNPDHLNKPAHVYDRIFVDCMKDGLVNSEYETWSRHRKMISRVFTYKSLQAYLSAMNLHSRNLTKSLTTECSPGIDNNTFKIEGDKVWLLLYFHAIKIIGAVVMGEDRLSDEETSSFHHSFYSYKRAVLERLLRPELHIPPYWYFHPKKKTYDRLSGDIDQFFDKIIKIYRNEYEQQKIVDAKKEGNGLENMKNTEDKENKNDVGERPVRCLIQEMLHSGATNKECYDEIGTFLMAGHETTVTALQFLFIHLALNPAEQAKCQQEIDNMMTAKGAHRNCDNEDVNLNMDDLSSLKHLERCIMESGRITPTIPMFLRRLDAPLKIHDDLVLPAGGNVAILTWMIHRDPEYYPDPETFDPSRFLPENVKKRPPYSYLPFSNGQRNCIGWKLSLMEMKVVASWVLFHFDISTSDKLEDVKLLFEVTLLPERNYQVTLTKRNKST